MNTVETITAIVGALLGGTSVYAIIENVRYRRENKRLKGNEVKSSDVEVQRQQMELADLYKEKVLETIELLSTKQEKGNVNQEKMIAMLSNLDRRIDIIEEDVGNIKGYLDGDLAAWVAKKKKEESMKEKRNGIVDEGEEDHE